MKNSAKLSIVLLTAAVSIALAGSIDVFEKLIPLAVGNKWVYQKGDEKIVEEIVEKKTVFLDDFYDEEVDVFVFHKNGKENEIKAYRHEDGGVAYVKLGTEYESENAPVFTQHHLLIPNEPEEGWYDPNEMIHRTAKFVWEGKDSIEVPAGKFEAYHNKFHIEGSNKIVKNFYAYSVGMIQSITLNTEGDTLEKTVLIEYDVKEED